MKQLNSRYKRNKIRLLIWTKVKFYSTKIMFKLVIWKEGFKAKVLALVSLDLDERLKSCEGLNIRG